MPSWIDSLGQLGNLSGEPVFAGLVITAAVIAVVHDWRFELWALLVQYVLISVLHLRMLYPLIQNDGQIPRHCREPR